MSMVEGISLYHVRRIKGWKPVEYEIPSGLVPRLFDFIIDHDRAFRYRSMKTGKINERYNWLLVKSKSIENVIDPDAGEEPKRGASNELRPCYVVIHDSQTNRITAYELAINPKGGAKCTEVLSERETHRLLNRVYTAMQNPRNLESVPEEPLMKFNVVGNATRNFSKFGLQDPNADLQIAKDKQMKRLAEKIVVKEYTPTINNIQR